MNVAERPQAERDATLPATPETPAVGFRGTFRLRVIRAHPTRRQRLTDALSAFLRRLAG